MKGPQVLLLLLAILLAGLSPADASQGDVKVVSHVDLQKYSGLWYEIARYPNYFQKDCVGSRATYTLLKSGKLKVLNECYDESFEGRLRSVEGKAWVADESTNSKLKVSFFWPFRTHYWIMELGRDYEYAVVGHPKRKYLWILSRTKQMSPDLYEAILERVRSQGYDPSRLIVTPHSSE